MTEPRTPAGKRMLTEWCDKERWGYLWPDVQAELLARLAEVEQQAAAAERARLVEKLRERGSAVHDALHHEMAFGSCAHTLCSDRRDLMAYLDEDPA